MSATLLQPVSTPLERALADTAASLLLADTAEVPRNLRSDIDSAVAPWLAAEWFLADFSKFFGDDPAALIEAGLPWLHQRGTPAAVARALGWIGLDVTLEEDGARLQIDPGIVIRPDQLDDIIQLVTASIPAHVWFYRMYHGYDIRPFYLDRSRLDSAALDDDSGVWVSGVKLSFGTRAVTAIPQDPEPPIAAVAHRLYSSRIHEDNSWRLDAWELDSEILLDAASGVISSHTGYLPDDPDQAPTAWMDSNSSMLQPIDADIPVAGLQNRSASGSVADPVRGWTGGWTGPWREPIPSRTTFED